MSGGGGGNDGGGKSRRKPQGGGSLASVGGGSGGDLPADDPCDLIIDVDLDSLQLPQLQAVRTGELLRVELQVSGRAQAAVCVRRDGSVVGSLSGFQGLTRLLRCLAQGHAYQVAITSLSRTSCHVRGGRASLP